MTRIGKVYFVSAPGRIKIGYTVNPDDRLAKLRHVDMDELSVIGIVDGTRKLERHLHNELSPYLLKGEWFLDCAVVRSAIDGCMSTRHDQVAEPESPKSALDEGLFVSEASQCCEQLLRTEKRNGATASEALSLVAIKTGLAHSRVWQLKYRKPSAVTAAELQSLRDHTGPQNHVVRAAKTLVAKSEESK